MWRKFNPAKPLLETWMPVDSITVQHVIERICAMTGKTITVQADLLHVDGTLLYRAVPPNTEATGMLPQVEIGRMALAIQCNAHMLAPQ